MTIIAYTDGACKGNGKAGASVGGFGTHIIYPTGDVLNIWGGESDTTNNRMELMGAITALERTPADTPIQIWTDSGYVKNGITQWINGWKAKGWKKADGKAVLNQDLWIRLDNACQRRTIDWQWIKGHAGHVGNEMADKLANDGVTGSGELFISHVPTNNPASNTQTDNKTNTEPNIISKETDETTTMNETTNHALDDSNFHGNDFHDNAAYESNLGDDMGYYANMANMVADDEFDPATPMVDVGADINDSEPVSQNQNETPAKKSKKKTPPAPMQVVRHNHQNPDYDGRTDEIREPFWAILPDPIHRGASERQLIMDTETTGIDPATGDRIVEIGIVEMVKRKPTGVQLHVYLNPDREMDDEVIGVHGIHNEFLVDKPRFADVAPYVYEFMKGAEIIAHNAQFDMKFLSHEFDKVGMTDFADVVEVTDSLMLARKMYAGQKNNLDALAKRLDVGQDIDRSYHGALKDSQILLEVYLAMTSGQIAMSMEEEGASQDDNRGEISFSDLSALSAQLIRSKDDFSADGAWRESVLK
ncbi:DNA polymerase III subunit epsilon [Moraxella lacunata]|uniref:DNA polymerase III subunit epsilon n=1 Tax=Moraxella lacunata TaxID=477 RepID=A0A378QF83_MORLA|nr:DNA polymerase III subunit epsilon [Moraxella lacunata]STY99495.1 DNA polymerase III subunit epsilon [Moraxella lacunata]